MLIDMTHFVDDLAIISDSTERQAGLSYAHIGFHSSATQPSHFFLAHLQPQPNGAAFASFKIRRPYNLEGNSGICIEGSSLNYSKAFYHLIIDTQTSQELGFTYQKSFPMTPREDFKFCAQFSDFIATRRGDLIDTAPPLDPSAIQSLGLRLVGRVDQTLRIYQQGLFGVQLYRICTTHELSCSFT